MKVKKESKKAGLKLNIQKTKIMASCPITSWQIDWDNVEKFQISFSWAPKSMWMVTAPGNQKMLAPWKKSYDKARQYIKKQRHGFADKYPYSQSYAFTSSHVWMVLPVVKPVHCSMYHVRVGQ